MSQSLFAADASADTLEVARMALPLPVDGLFEYNVPPGLAAQAAPGCRALVRFGSRHLTGVIVERVREAEHRGELRPLVKLVDSEPVLSAALLDILREAAADVFCPLGMALAAALPAGSTPRIVRGFALTPRGRAALASGVVGEQTRPLLAALEKRPLSAAALRARCGGAQADARLRALEDDGLVERREVEGRQTARVARQRIAALTPGVDVEEALSSLARAPRQAALLRCLTESGEMPLEALAKSFPPRLVRELSRRGLVDVHERAAPRDVLGVALEQDRSVTLSADQARALEPIEGAIAASRPEAFLLHGVTGSGKTEIYLRGVGAALRAGRQALVLVPEISLTHQIVARLRGRFGDELAVLHSGLRPGERLEQWQRLRAGATPIAVGARSALFAPLEKLGIIVIDEEHDSAYKNDEGFRYHARDLALRRAERAGCPLVLGSATPSLEVRFAADRGELRRLELPHRIGGRPLPAVEIVDLAREAERERRGRRPILSRPLRRAMAETLEADGQTILFLNRRGFSTQVMCFECGRPERCPDCDVALVFHATEQVLRCHYCEHQIPPPDECRGCGAPGAALLGLGTERLEEEVRTRFPDARIARLDRDTASRRGYTESVLRGLRDRRIDILIGTQMVAKGHDFPGVRVVGVVAADIGLHMPDFRAAERTFQLLTQVAGRAGRDSAPGRVIVQTFVPNHYAIRPVRDHDYESFYVEELSHRAELGFPPFGRLAYVLLSSPELEVAMAAAQALALALDAAGAIGPQCARMGPAPAPLARLRGRHRVQLLLRGEAEPVRRAAGILAAAIPGLDGDVQAALDVNPVHML